MLQDFLWDPNYLTHGERPNDRGCLACGKIGHLVKDCPRRQQHEKKRRDLKLKHQQQIKQLEQKQQQQQQQRGKLKKASSNKSVAESANAEVKVNKKNRKKRNNKKNKETHSVMRKTRRLRKSLKNDPELTSAVQNYSTLADFDRLLIKCNNRK